MSVSAGRRDFPRPSATRRPSPVPTIYFAFQHTSRVVPAKQVPFRLTRDMVDGLGVTGVEGLYRRACETSLRCLRRPDNAAALLTLAEVFIHDPLYRWMISPLQAINRQRNPEGGADGGADEASVRVAPKDSVKDLGGPWPGPGDAEREEAGGSREAAERTLARIRQKLQGYEDPNDSALSVEGQVRLLIASASSEENLHKIYYGWAPWL